MTRFAAVKWLYRLSRITFVTTFVLAMMTPTWRKGTFVHWPMLHFKMQGIEIQLGLLTLIPLLSLIGWTIARLLERPRRSLSYGAKCVALAVFGFGVWTLIRAWPIHLKHVAFVTVISILLFWAIYLYTIDNMPKAWVLYMLAALLLLQGLAGTTQFLRQGSIGLFWMGENQLDPMAQGVSVIESAGQRWVRAYGLTAHPNMLGGYLAMCATICLSALGTDRRLPRPLKWSLWLSLVAGLLGLFFTFSRSAWLGMAAGLIYLAWLLKPWKHLDWRSPGVRRIAQIAGVLLLVVLATLTILFGDLMITRLFRLKNPLEATSIRERLIDIDQAWSLIRVIPFKGTGSGYYVGALWARVTDPNWKGFRLIHNIPLLVTAELGVQGLILWLWLILGPPVVLARRQQRAQL
ncbi:MAG: O-antigen ligase family protein, partial [Anaerolineae bacterium]|nr:O-antigen ligase family protein [Anaerolineae bacterium]